MDEQWGPKNDAVTLYAALAFEAMIRGDTEHAEAWALRIPRSERGRIRIALEDLGVLIEHLGRRTDGQQPLFESS